MILDELDKIDWRQYAHAYGVAIDIPAMMRALLRDDQTQVENQLAEFINTINHQGDLYSVTPVVIPFIMELINYDAQKYSTLIFFLISIAYDAERFSDGANRRSPASYRLNLMVYDALVAQLATLRDLLRNSDPLVRFAVVQLLVFFPEHSHEILQDIYDLILSEAHERTRMIMANSLGKIINRMNWRLDKHILHAADIFDQLIQKDSSPAVRVTAAESWVSLKRNYNNAHQKYADQGNISAGATQILQEAYFNPPQLPRDKNWHEWFENPLDARTILEALAELGRRHLRAPLYNLLEHPELTVLQAHQVAREMLDLVFHKRSFETVPPYYVRQTQWWLYQEASNPFGYVYRPNSMEARYLYVRAKPLLAEQRDVLTRITSCNIFWQEDTNLFSFFYDLPDQREELQALLSHD